MKTRIKLILIALALSLSVLTIAANFSLAYNYEPMEAIPGFAATGDFQTFIKSFYSFGIWAVGIAALLMVFIGGYMYFMSAGNSSQMEKAKGIITNALLGVVLALGAWLILYVINPDLVKVDIGSISGLKVNQGAGSSSQQAGTTSNCCECVYMYAARRCYNGTEFRNAATCRDHCAFWSSDSMFFENASCDESTDSCVSS